LAIIFLLLLLFVSSYYLIQQPKVQTFFVHKISDILSKELGNEVKIDSVNLKFIKTLEIHRLFISSNKNKKDTILFANKLYVNVLLGETLIDQITHLKNGKIFVNNLEIDGLRLNGYRAQNDSLFNFNFILEKFASKDKKKKKTQPSNPIELKLNSLKLTNGNLVLDDQFKDHRFDIRYKKVFVDVREFNINNLKIDAKKLELEDPYFKLTDYNEVETGPKDPNKKKKMFDPQELGKLLNLTVDNLTIKNGTHTMDFKKKEQKAGLFLISKMHIHDINLEFNDYKWDSTGMHLKMKKLAAVADNGLNLKKLTANVTLDNGGIYLDDADIAFNNSVFKTNLSLQFMTGDWTSFKNFQDDVMMKADIKELNAKSKDIATFAPKILKFIPNDIYMRGLIKGKLANIRVDKLYATTGKNTVIDISGNIKGLPKINQTLFDLKINEIRTNPTDLKGILSYVKLPKQLDKAGNISFKGTYFGFLNDFVAKGNLNSTGFGNLVTDIRMNFPKGQAPSYSGKVVATGLNIAELTGNSKLFGTIDLDINADGKGFNANQLNTKLNGTIRNFYLNGFVFDEIKINGFLDKKKFSGKAFFDDDCFLVDFNGIVDLNDKLPKFDFKTSIKNADLNKLNLSKDTFLISLDGEVHGSGKSLENLNGKGIFSNIIVQNTKNILALSDVAIDMKNNGNERDYALTSDQFNASAKGLFDPLSIVPSMKVYLANYTKLIKPTEKDYKKAKPQQFDANIQLNSDFGIFKVFVPKLDYLSELKIDANVNTNTNLLHLVGKLDSSVYSKIHLNDISINGDIVDKNFILNTNVNKLQTGKTIVNKINLKANSSIEQLLTTLSIAEDTAKNALKLVSTLDFNKDSITAKFLESSIKVNNKIWKIEDGNKLTILDSIFITQNFSLVQDDQKIKIVNGRNSLSDAKINIENINLADISQLIDTTGKIKNGRLSGNVKLKNILTKMQVDADLNINDLQVLDYKVKIIGLSGIYGKDGKKIIELNGSIDDNDYQLAFDGIYDMQKKGNEKFDINADIQKLNLSFLEALLKKELLIPHAFIKGQVNIAGNVKKPILTGDAQIIDTAILKMRYLGTTFKLYDEKIKLNNRGFDFGEMKLYDNFGNTATLSGKLMHNSFKDWETDANLNAPNGFNFMNTSFDDNQDFYGKVFAKGDVDLKGKFNDLFINATVKTLKNTVFNLPVSGKTNDKGYSWVKFVDPNDTIKKIDYKTKLSGLNITLNIEATPDATANIILDQAANDKIIGKGAGDITVTLSKKGEIAISGVYDITEGKYDFSFQGAINKTFKIKKGSTITFNGNPMDADLNITALYNVKNASVKNIVDSTSNIRNRTYPIDLNLKITNTLDKPKIGFAIAPTEGTISAQTEELKRKLDEISANENDVNNNAATLLLFNTFFPTGSSGDQKLTGFSSTVTDLIFSQISSIISSGLSQLIKGASLDIVLNDIENSSRNFGFSYKQEAVNGRLILTIGGNVNLGTTETSNALGQTNRNTAVAGDFVLEYLITQDGRIRFKTFARTANYDILNQDKIRTGGAISFQKDFDNLKDLFTTKKKREKEKPIELPKPLPILPKEQPIIDTLRKEESIN
jgi:hypothetical protein